MKSAFAMTLLLAATAARGAPTDADCKAAIPQFQPAGKDDGCDELATMVYDAVKDRLTKESAPAPRAVQPILQLGDASGSGAQSTAVPSGFPTPQAGGNVGLAGTRSGPRLMTTLAVNPLSLGASTTKTLAWASRTLDLTVVLPIQTGQPAAAAKPQSFDYVGIRARVNALGLSSGDSAFEAVRSAYSDYAVTSVSLSRAVEAALRGAPDVGRCAKALAGGDDVSAAATCGGAVSLSAMRDSDAAFRDKLRSAVWEADRQYLGLDLRADIGDPTFSNDPTRRGTNLIAALGAGKRLGDRARYLMLRGRAGVAYASLDGGATAYSFEGGLAVELGSLTDLQAIRTSIGIEGRKTSKDAGAVDTNYADLHVDLSVPLATGSSVTVGFSAPLGSSSHGSLLTVGGDWSMLLPALQQSQH